MNAQQQASYAQAKQLYASAQQAMAQSSLLLSQTTGQNLTNTRDQAYMNSQAYQNQLKYGNSNGAPAASGGGQSGSNNGETWSPTSAGGGHIGNFMANTAWGADASQAAHGIGNYAKGLFTGASW